MKSRFDIEVRTVKDGPVSAKQLAELRSLGEKNGYDKEGLREISFKIAGTRVLEEIPWTKCKRICTYIENKPRRATPAEEI